MIDTIALGALCTMGTKPRQLDAAQPPIPGRLVTAEFNHAASRSRSDNQPSTMSVRLTASRVIFFG